MELTTVCDGISALTGEKCRRFELPAIYFVKGEYGAIVDPGPASIAASIMTAMKELGWSRDYVRYIIPTHIHLDHGGGAGYLAREFPLAKGVVYAPSAHHMIDPTNLIAGTAKVFGENFAEEFGEILPVPKERVVPVNEGDRIDLGGRKLEIFYTPGHAPHHISLLDDKTKALICGEAVGHYLPIVEAIRPTVAQPMLDLDAALQTLDKLSKLDVGAVLFAEWGVSYDAPKVFRMAKKAFRDYADIVLKGLKAGLTTEQITEKLIAFEKSQWPDFDNLPRHWMHEHPSIAKGLSYYFRKQGLV